MDDKTMLELAAKACGAYWFGHYGCWYMGDNPWNPLTDDGDALRLAVKLRLELEYAFGDQGECVCQYWIGGEGFKRLTQPIDGNPYAATRRAIVRAAAEIGKGMGEVDDAPAE